MQTVRTHEIHTLAFESFRFLSQSGDMFAQLKTALAAASRGNAQTAQNLFSQFRLFEDFLCFDSIVFVECEADRPREKK